MATLLRVPEVAAGATEVVLSEWLVDEGATIEAGTPVVVVETEKAVVEVEAESGGVLLKRLTIDGATVEVGTPFALVGTAEESSSDPDDLLAGLGVSVSPDEASTPGTSPTASAQTGPAHAAPEPETAPEPEVDADPEPAPTDHARNHAPAEPEKGDHPAAEGGRIFATPIARRILAEAGIALASVEGTGPNGRIVKADALSARSGTTAERDDATATDAHQPSSSTPRAERSDDGIVETPHSRLRRAVATRLTASKQTVPHFYVTRSVRLDALLTLRAQLNEVSSQRISVNDLVVRAVGVTHRDLPEANVVWSDDAMRQFSSADVGVAIASDRGLVTPVLRAVEQASVGEVARRIRSFADQARDGKLHQHDLEGGSISVTNLGMFGVEEFAAIINPPQSAILAVGAAVPTPVVTDGEVGVATVARLVLSVDHRAIDGALAARWMAALVENLEAPLRLLA